MQQPDNKTPNKISGWLAEHPTIKLLGSLVAIVGGMLGIISFMTGFTSLPEILARLNSKYYDRFEINNYEGGYNTSLWERDGNEGVLVEQRDGALVLQPVNVTEDGNVALFPIQQSPIPFEEFRAMEAKLKMSGNIQGTGFIKTQAFTIRDGKNWWIECKFEMLVAGQANYSCNVETGKYDDGGSPIYTYETDKVPVEFDRWYLSRFEVDPELGRIRFYLDYRLIGEYTQKGGLYFSSLYPQIGSWVDRTNNFVGYFDDIRIERKP